MTSVIDARGFRKNVGMIICNAKNEVLWGKRKGQQAWQFPQGGLQEGETCIDALFRELEEEVGLKEKDIEVLGVTKSWLYYRLPPTLIRYGSRPLCVGQMQRWFLLRLLEGEKPSICLNTHEQPEFDAWNWVSYWYPIRYVIDFKREVYRKALKELSISLWGRRH